MGAVVVKDVGLQSRVAGNPARQLPARLNFTEFSSNLLERGLQRSKYAPITVEPPEHGTPATRPSDNKSRSERKGGSGESFRHLISVQFIPGACRGGAEPPIQLSKRRFIRAQATDRVLEVGCGDSAHARPILVTSRYVGIDHNSQYIADARTAIWQSRRIRNWGSRDALARWLPMPTIFFQCSRSVCCIT